ncbi:3'-5' exonuclease [Truepera radiovictrix]|uniref:Exonuclease RNase T and DNA polymerase III n=1 Tax=Truepera radiovictrix (strain DSM 17093 / CIP 108686 / LMG 22925 / RQ-24) TaxID=649638 RepID=D7CY27_TRURR|nr:3'-5' exonuclease [Truepera radiovictrix]ADI13387.1 Exonuclease RNase T and DNA polymerase III [Truepera radiovictrix DSM 17093]WMT58050.1 3'-5' exonuclease [Truepera radiovictrix]
MWDWVLEARRRWWRRRRVAPPLQRFLAHALPDPRGSCRDAEYVAVDLETTGLRPRWDAPLSVGWVLVRAGAIELATARYAVLRAKREVAQSATVHGLTDDAVADGEDAAAVLAELLAVLAGRVLVAHHAAIELRFLDRLCREHFGGPLLVRVVDTLALAARSAERHGAVDENALRLHAVRARYGLPRYAAHSALSDALATAELLLALTAEREGSGGLPLRRLLR